MFRDWLGLCVEAAALLFLILGLIAAAILVWGAICEMIAPVWLRLLGWALEKKGEGNGTV